MVPPVGVATYRVKEAEKPCWRGVKFEGAAAASAAKLRRAEKSMMVVIEVEAESRR